MDSEDARAKAECLHLVCPSFPVDVHEMARELHIEVRLGEIGKCSGFYVAGPDWACMVINERHPYTRRRWTMAHEIGHHVMPSTRDDDMFDVQLYSRKERIANQFAAHLLMPEDEVRLRFPLYMNATWEETAIEMGKQFNVSHNAAQYRLKELGLITTDSGPDQIVSTVYGATSHMPQDQRLVVTEQIAGFLARVVQGE